MPVSRTLPTETRQAASLREILPANSFILLGAVWTPRLIKVNEIDHDVFGPKIFGKLLFACGFVAEDHNFGGAQRAFEVGR